MDDEMKSFLMAMLLVCGLVVVFCLAGLKCDSQSKEYDLRVKEYELNMARQGFEQRPVLGSAALAWQKVAPDSSK